MAKRISDEAFDALHLSQQLEFVAAHLHETDEQGIRGLNNEDIGTMLMHCLCMARSAKAMERELRVLRDDAKLRVLRLSLSWAQAEDPETNVIGWPIVRRGTEGSVARDDYPKGAA